MPTRKVDVRLPGIDLKVQVVLRSCMSDWCDDCWSARGVRKKYRDSGIVEGHTSRKRVYDTEFREGAVRIVTETGKPIPEGPRSSACIRARCTAGCRGPGAMARRRPTGRGRDRPPTERQVRRQQLADSDSKTASSEASTVGSASIGGPLPSGGGGKHRRCFSAVRLPTRPVALDHPCGRPL